MMRYMMDDDQIHQDVVNMLWQVYSERAINLYYSYVSKPPLIRF